MLNNTFYNIELIHQYSMPIQCVIKLNLYVSEELMA